MISSRIAVEPISGDGKHGKSFLRVFQVLLFVLFCPGALLFSQNNPIDIDLRCHGYKLDAKFLPSGKNEPSPALILLHGFPGNPSSPLGLAEKLNSAGLNVLFFNYQGSFGSEGEFSFENCMANVAAAIEFLKNDENSARWNIDPTRIVVCGYSFGGAIALESAIHDENVRNIIAIGNDDHSVSLKKAAADMSYRAGYEQFISKSFGPGGSFRGDVKTVLDDNIKNVDRYDLVKNADKLKDKNILFIVGWLDTTSFLEVNTLPLFRRLMQLNAKNTAINGFESDHSFRNVKEDLVSTIVSWINALNG